MIGFSVGGKAFALRFETILLFHRWHKHKCMNGWCLPTLGGGRFACTAALNFCPPKRRKQLHLPNPCQYILFAVPEELTYRSFNEGSGIDRLINAGPCEVSPRPENFPCREQRVTRWWTTAPLLRLGAATSSASLRTLHARCNFIRLLRVRLHFCHIIFSTCGRDSNLCQVLFSVLQSSAGQSLLGFRPGFDTNP